MNILLDTCSVLWYFNGNDEMPLSTREAILNADNFIFVSIASVWEVAIKISIGKLCFDGGIDRFIEAIKDEGFGLLEINPRHIKLLINLPFIHRDPFDRMLIAQATIEKLHIMTTDSEISKYNVNTIWQ